MPSTNRASKRQKLEMKPSLKGARISIERIIQMINATSPDHVFSNLKEQFLYFLRKYPELAMEQFGTPSSYPLVYLACYKDVALEDVKEVYAMNPDAVSEPLSLSLAGGVSLLCLVCNHRAADDVIQFILEKYPAAASYSKEEFENGRHPLDELLCREEQQASIKTIQMLYDASAKTIPCLASYCLRLAVATAHDPGICEFLATKMIEDDNGGDKPMRQIMSNTKASLGKQHVAALSGLFLSLEYLCIELDSFDLEAAPALLDHLIKSQSLKKLFIIATHLESQSVGTPQLVDVVSEILLEKDCNLPELHLGCPAGAAEDEKVFPLLNSLRHQRLGKLESLGIRGNVIEEDSEEEEDDDDDDADEEDQKKRTVVESTYISQWLQEGILPSATSFGSFTVKGSWIPSSMVSSAGVAGVQDLHIWKLDSSVDFMVGLMSHIATMKNLKKLNLFHHFNKSVDFVTAPLETLLALNRLKSLRVTGCKLDVGRICGALETNKGLEALHINVEEGDSNISILLELYENLLENHNATLKNLTLFHRASHQVDQAKQAKFVYFLWLNRLGRQEARDPNISSMDRLVALLSNVLEQEPEEETLDLLGCADSCHFKIMMHYGLLRESASTWSQQY